MIIWRAAAKYPSHREFLSIVVGIGILLTDNDKARCSAPLYKVDKEALYLFCVVIAIPTLLQTMSALTHIHTRGTVGET